LLAGRRFVFFALNGQRYANWPMYSEPHVGMFNNAIIQFIIVSFAVF
jgi:hypothetical protein